MILGFKTVFADGSQTNFRSKIEAAKDYISPNLTNDQYCEFLQKLSENPGWKIHTLRESNRYEGRRLQLATGVRTKWYECFLETRCVSTQKVSLFQHDSIIEAYVEGRKLSNAELHLLVRNDGVDMRKFTEWFFAESDQWHGYIIHFTPFKYVSHD